MFESDDFDEILSQYEIPETPNSETSKPISIIEVASSLSFIGASQVTPHNKTLVGNNKNNDSNIAIQNTVASRTLQTSSNSMVSPKHIKRKIIRTHFDHQSKRKFPGPAGLLTPRQENALDESIDENISQIELLSQDIDYSYAQVNLFESLLWKDLLKYVSEWSLDKVDSVNTIKQQALSGHLRKGKAQVITAFVSAVDRSVIDPLVVLRDSSGSIKCTLHRDAWSAFSSYIVSECCALVLWKPTVLTTGGAFKKHYLTITLSNIVAIYSTAILKDDQEEPMPDGYTRLCKENYTIIKASTLPSIEIEANETSRNKLFDTTDDILDDIDISSFTDIF